MHHKKASVFPYMPCSMSQLPAALGTMKAELLQWFACPVEHSLGQKTEEACKILLLEEAVSFPEMTKEHQ